MTTIQRPNSRPVASTLLAVLLVTSAVGALVQGFSPTAAFAGAALPFNTGASVAKPALAGNSMAYVTLSEAGGQYLHFADIANQTDSKVVPYPIAGSSQIAASGDYVAWSNGYMNKWNVFLFDKYSSHTQVIADSMNEIGRPSTDGGQVVWREAGFDLGGAQIKYFNAATQELRTVTVGKQYSNPVIAGSNIAWFETAEGCKNDAYRLCDSNYTVKNLVVYNVDSKLTQVIAQNIDSVYAPAISTSRVVWTQKVNGHYDLFNYDLSGGQTTRLTNNDLDETYPVLANGRIGYLGMALGGTQRIAHVFTIGSREDIAMPFKGYNHGFVSLADNYMAWVENRPESRIKLYNFNIPASAADVDSDGLSQETEQKVGTDTEKKDSDGDGISDTDEIVLFHTNPTAVDSDADGINDYKEIFYVKTNPLKFDTDGDGYYDGLEVKTNHNPFSASKVKINPAKFFRWTAPAR
jgi:hypothetical protein